MKTISFRKLTAIMDIKSRTLFSKNFIIMPIFSLGFTFLMRVLYKSILGEAAGTMTAYALSIGVLMNICMSGVYCVAASLAEEKEKHTLRTLMTSSVNGLEFFLGSLIPAILMMMFVNIACVFLSGFSMNPAQWAGYLFISTACSIAGAIIGMIFGIFSKNQMSAGTATTPVLLIFMMIPMFSQLNDTLGTISGFLFTGILSDAISNIGRQTALLSIRSGVILTAEILLTVILFLMLYKKKGFDAD